MDSTRRKFLALLGCAGVAIPTFPQTLGTNIAPTVPMTPSVKEALSQLQMGFPRPEVLRWFSAKTLAGDPTKLGAVDLGNLMSAVDNNGDVYPAYTSYFKHDGRYVFSSVDKILCESSRDSVANTRMQEDFAAVEALGVDPSSIEFV
jgi:hypothetical protein